MIKNFIFLGAPGVGKGTLADKLEKEKGVKHISTGDIFRENIKNETPLGLKVKEIISKGEYVPDDITNQIVKNALQTEEVKKNGFLLDGYPRTKNQAQFLKDNGFDITAAVLLHATDEVVTQRLLARARGEDDTIEVIRHRLEVYNEQTKPLIDFYKEENLLVTIDSHGTIDENFDRLLGELY